MLFFPKWKGTLHHRHVSFNVCHYLKYSYGNLKKKKKKRTKKWIKQKGENYKREDHQHTRKTKWRLGKRLQVLKLQYMYTTYNDIYIFILDLTFLIHLPVPLPVHQKNRYGIYTYKTHIFYTYYTPSFLPAPIFGSSFSWRDLTKWPNFSTPRVFSTVFMSLILAIERRQFSPDNIPVCLVFKFFLIKFFCHLFRWCHQSRTIHRESFPPLPAPLKKNPI